MGKRIRRKNYIIEALFSILSAVPRLFSGRRIKKRAERNLLSNKKFEDERQTLGFADNQELFDGMYFGSQRFSKCGCEVIAVYNALRSAGKKVGLSALVHSFELSKSMMWWGYLGSSPTRLDEWFGRENIKCVKTYDMRELEEKSLDADCIIISCWNRHMINGLHTFMVRYENGRFHAYNGYKGFEYGGSLSEFVKNNKMIVGYLIGEKQNGFVHGSERRKEVKMNFSCFKAADILLPDFSKVDGSKWAVIACDQYTSEPEYWNGVEETVGDAPSALRVTLPEVYLSETEKRVPEINAEMERYLKEYLVSHEQSMIYLERTQANGKIRRGIVGMIDLEEYDFSKGATSLIRATEGTVISRIPPRVKIRRDAAIELPHVLLLIDDPERTVIEQTAKASSGFETAYDFDLMQNGGHVIGRFVPENEQKRIISALEALGMQEEMKKKYGGDFAPLIFAVGDGNHSLATAKTCYEELKLKLGADAAMKSPARYALVEIENLHDDTLVFEPIYRVVFGADVSDLVPKLKEYASALNGAERAQSITAVTKDGDEGVTVGSPVSPLAVGTLQKFLDAYAENHSGVEIDYIHGEESLRKLASGKDAVGFLFSGMKKDELFRTVLCDGALPRKTFSMGHADDKRFYIEARKIK